MSITVCILVSILQLTASNIPSASPLNVFQNEKVIILNPSSEYIQADNFSIKNAFGEVVFNQELNKYNNAVKFNLAKLPSGIYSITVSGENFVEMHEATITEETLNLNYTQAYYRPSVKELDEKVIVEADLVDEEITISIYDEAGNLVYDFSDQKFGKFKRAFNLEQLKTGQYNVIVSTDYFVETSIITL